MPMYRVHRMKENPRQQFRWAPHTGGVMNVKPRDYEPGGVVVAESCYEAWMSLRGTAEALDIGDILESEPGGLRICKYVGFEEARWVLPEMKTGLEGLPAAAGPDLPSATGVA
jgi:hypothetical protein